MDDGRPLALLQTNNKQREKNERPSAFAYDNYVLVLVSDRPSIFD